MGFAAAAAYGVLGTALLAAGATIRSQASMAGVPLYDADGATNPAALAGVVGASLAAFGVATLAFAAVEAVDRTSVVVVAGYAIAVLCIALAAGSRTRRYE